jgi:UDP-N-acetylglucosamine acyltransferase
MTTADVSVLREIADGAQVAADAVIGPFCFVGPEASIGPRTVLGPRVTVTGRTTIGADNVIQAGCVLGQTPQDLKFRGHATYLIIGRGNRLGPNVTAHIGTEPGGFLTRIGDGNILESGAHVAHDCFVDDHAYLGQGVLLGGHIRVETGAHVEAMVGVHHFSTIGRFARVGARTPVRRDVPPFTFFTGLGLPQPAIVGPNERGLSAADLPEDEKTALLDAIRRLFEDEQAMSVKIGELLAQSDLPPSVRELCGFCLRSGSGNYGRYRETYRGKLPPEARTHLPRSVLQEIESRRQP